MVNLHWSLKFTLKVQTTLMAILILLVKVVVTISIKGLPQKDAGIILIFYHEHQCVLLHYHLLIVNKTFWFSKPYLNGSLKIVVFYILEMALFLK